MSKLEKYFEFANHQTNLRIEVLAGLSTFLSMAYIFVVNPSILGEAGFDKSAVLFATVVTSFFATAIMGLWAKKPFVVAPGMEMNAYVAFFVVGGLGFDWQQALGAVFWSGVLFIVLTASNVRTRIIGSIPYRMKSGIALSVGVFLMLIALRLANVLVYERISFSHVGHLFSKESAVLCFGLFTVVLLRRLQVRGAILISIAFSTAVTAAFGLTNTAPPVLVSSAMLSAVGQLDIGVILDPRIWGVILILFLVDFYGSVAKFIGLTRNTTIVDEHGNFPNMKEALTVDGMATTAGALVGTTSLTTYVESGVGIAEGGRTGLTAIVCAVLMLLFIPLAPVVNFVPVIATTGALFWVGIMLTPRPSELFEYELTDLIAVIGMVIVTIFTFAIDRALLFGFIVYLLQMLWRGKGKSVDAYLLVSTVLLMVGFVCSLL